MLLTEEFEAAVNATVSIDFQNENCTVSFFESTIRYLGGLLGAYDLSHELRLVPKLVELGDMLLRAFNTTNGMPYRRCPLATNATDASFEPSPNAPLADVGSLTLEFSRLSLITGVNKYMDAVNCLSAILYQYQTNSTIPALWPEKLDTTSIEGSGKLVRRSWRYSKSKLSDTDAHLISLDAYVLNTEAHPLRLTARSRGF